MSFAGITVLAVAAMAGFVMGESCYCPMNYDPICASNGQVFSNLCMMRCHNYEKHENLVVAESDVCTKKPSSFLAIPESCYCPMNYDPICASNGQVFSNRCMMGCHNYEKHDNLVVAESDVCTKKPSSFLAFPKLNCFRMCPHTPLLVCGSDGITYGSACALECLKKIENDKADVTVAHRGSCQKVTELFATEFGMDAWTPYYYTLTRHNKFSCFRRCPHTPLPVCGSDGMTYGSSCALDCVKQMHNDKADLTVVHRGYCQ